MQAQVQIPGQVSAQTGGQLANLAQQNGSSLSSQTSNMGGIRRSWHMEFPGTDIYQLRQFITEKIMATMIAQPCEALGGSSIQGGCFKEYMNLSTLEWRLTTLMKRFQHNRNQNLSHHNPHVGTMIPTPGLQKSGNVSAMIPTPSTHISTVNGPGTSTAVPNTVGMGKMLPNTNENVSLLQGNSLLVVDNNSRKMMPTLGLSNNAFPISGDNMSSLMGPLNNAFQSQQSISTSTGNIMPTMGLARVGSQMIPTPGLNTPHSMPMSSTCSGGLSHSNVDAVTTAQQHQLQHQKQLQMQQQQLHQKHMQFSGRKNTRIYHNMNGQMGGTMGINMPHKNSSYGLLNGGMNNGMQLLSGNQHFVNGTTPHPNTGSYLNPSRFSNLQMPS